MACTGAEPADDAEVGSTALVSTNAASVIMTLRFAARNTRKTVDVDCICDFPRAVMLSVTADR